MLLQMALFRSFYGQVVFLGVYICCYFITKSYLTLCDPVDYSTPGFPVHHQLPESAQTHVH